MVLTTGQNAQRSSSFHSATSPDSFRNRWSDLPSVACYETIPRTVHKLRLTSALSHMYHITPSCTALTCSRSPTLLHTSSAGANTLEQLERRVRGRASRADLSPRDLARRHPRRLARRARRLANRSFLGLNGLARQHWRRLHCRAVPSRRRAPAAAWRHVRVRPRAYLARACMRSRACDCVAYPCMRRIWTGYMRRIWTGYSV